MKLEYEQKFSTGMPSSPIAKVVETSQGQKQYFYGKDAIDEQRFQKLFTNMQHNGSLVESKKLLCLMMPINKFPKLLGLIMKLEHLWKHP